jgi:hypothetical protein
MNALLVELVLCAVVAAGASVATARVIKRARGRRGSQLSVDAPGNRTYDGLRTDSWELVTALVFAAHRGDAKAFRACTRRQVTLAAGNTAGLYVMKLLRGAVLLALRREPTPDDLRSIATEVQPRLAANFRIDDETALGALETGHAVEGDGRDIRGANFLVVAAALLGVMLADPDSELVPLRAMLAGWAENNEEWLREVVGPG